MSPCDHIDSASLYALGLLDDAEARAFEQHLKSCPSCEAEVREAGDLGVELAGTIPLSPPPDGLRQRVLAESVLPRGVAALVRGAQMNFRPTPYSGVTVARLYEDAARGELTSLVRMMPGRVILRIVMQAWSTAMSWRVI
jgi:anti-sigma factor RsiW